MKIVVSNPKTGKTYQKEVDDKKARAIHNKRIGQEISGSLLDIDGYQLEITGGSDKQGFPMRRGLKTAERKKLLLKGGTGYRPKERGIKKRKTVRGEIVEEDIEQLNLKVTKKGKKDLEVIFGIKQEEETEKDKEEQKETEKEETGEKTRKEKEDKKEKKQEKEETKEDKPEKTEQTEETEKDKEEQKEDKKEE